MKLLPQNDRLHVGTLILMNVIVGSYLIRWSFVFIFFNLDKKLFELVLFVMKL